MWAYVRGILRKLKVRTKNALVDVVVAVLDCVTPELVAAWFKRHIHHYVVDKKLNCCMIKMAAEIGAH
jgi:hypothetical protein